MVGQAGCLQGLDLSAVTHPSSSHARRCLIRVFHLDSVKEPVITLDTKVGSVKVAGLQANTRSGTSLLVSGSHRRRPLTTSCLGHLGEMP
ncbi:hypothetical protein J6590_064293 [Homalodisca vitripennis]|nr:hypothetical protein J6590_064293 [Homalodisca vitripennis]